MITTIQTHLRLFGRVSLFSGGFGGGGAGAGGAVAVVLGESLVLMVTGALGEAGALGAPEAFGLLPEPGALGVFGGFSANLWFLF
jgi:hypothetical protein